MMNGAKLLERIYQNETKKLAEISSEYMSRWPSSFPDFGSCRHSTIGSVGTEIAGYLNVKAFRLKDYVTSQPPRANVW